MKDNAWDYQGSKCDCEVMHGDTIEFVKVSIASQQELESMSKLLKVFGDGTRIRILNALECHEMCVCDLAVLFDMTKSAISHQLKVLRDNNLVKFEKKGKHAYYSLADEHVKEILDVALDHINE
ncbi:MAG: metalloregulator ArsR/SmtB family transcription factor [Bacillota bacterium]|nr:metalloregulator ArsR/SmtB family transcription factor [Bacillota bacterium]